VGTRPSVTAVALLHNAAMRARPGLGYALTALAATMFALNGPLARELFDEGVSPTHLSEMRSAVAFVLLALGLAVRAPHKLRIARADVGRMAWLGIAGLALVHASYFLAIDRLKIGVALAIQFTAPVALLVWLRVVHGRRLAPTLWGSVWLSVLGSFLVVEAYDAGALDALGVLFAVASMVTYVIYLVASERAGRRYDAFTIMVWGFGFATLFWLLVRPPWTFPWETFGSPRNLALGLGVAVIGTLAPFLLLVAALRHLPASRVGVVATLEPVLGALLAWALLDEGLGPAQLVGGCLVVTAALWVQAHPPAPEVEAAPSARRRGPRRASDTPGTARTRRRRRTAAPPVR
jgi:drug/metabolite transporter (DMT)-like permease